MEITDDSIAMEAIAFLQEKGYSIEQVLLAMAAKPVAEVKTEDLPPWPVGTVVRDTKTNAEGRFGAVAASFAQLTDDERLRLVSGTCHGCGRLDSGYGCNCQNDE